MNLFPNRATQTATFRTGSPSYVVLTGTAPDGRLSLSSLSSSQSWATGDHLGLLLYVSDTKYKLWTATWDDVSEILICADELVTTGSWTDQDIVVVSAVLTQEMLLRAATAPSRMITSVEAGTALTLTEALSGMTVVTTAVSAVTITLPTLPAGVHYVVVQEGSGAVSFAPVSGNMVNGDTISLSGPGQYRPVYLYQRVPGQWVITQ